MSRVRGNEPSVFPPVRGIGVPEEHPITKILADLHESWLAQRYKCEVTRTFYVPDPNDETRSLLRNKVSVDYGLLYKATRAFGARAHRTLQAAINKRPLIRNRTSGVVGPELDWSVVYSDVPFSLFHRPGAKYGEDYFGTGLRTSGSNYRIFPEDPNRVHREYGRLHASKHGCVITHMMTIENVIEWTSWAHRNNVHYHGNRGYVRVNREHVIDASLDDPKYLFQVRKHLGLIKSHGRSDLAKIRRSARRGKLLYTVKKPVPDLFVNRPILSAKHARESWVAQGSNGSLSRFKLEIPTCKALFPERCRTQVPTIVFRSLKRIYSGPVRAQPWFVTKPEKDLKLAFKADFPPVKAKFGALRAIEYSYSKLRVAHRYPPSQAAMPDILRTTIPRLRPNSENESRFGRIIGQYDLAVQRYVVE